MDSRVAICGSCTRCGRGCWPRLAQSRSCCHDARACGTGARRARRSVIDALLVLPEPTGCPLVGEWSSEKVARRGPELGGDVDGVTCGELGEAEDSAGGAGSVPHRCRWVDGRPFGPPDRDVEVGLVDCGVARGGAEAGSVILVSGLDGSIEVSGPQLWSAGIHGRGGRLGASPGQRMPSRTRHPGTPCVVNPGADRRLPDESVYERFLNR